MKLPQYVENVLQFLAQKEEKYLGTPFEQAYERMKKELIEESLTAKNPAPRDPKKEVKPEIKLGTVSKNPKIVQDEKKFSSNELDENLALFIESKEDSFFPKGFFALNLFNDPKSIQDVRDGKAKLLLFHPSTLSATSNFLNIWQKKTTNKNILAAIQGTILDDKIIIDFMSVRPKYRKRHINSSMIKWLKEKFPQREIEYVDLTEAGEKFVKKFKNPNVKNVIDALIEKGLTADQIHSKLLKLNYRGSKKGISDYMKKNPRASAGHDIEDFDEDQLVKGATHEMEHTDSIDEAMRIAMDHLVEDKNYYKKLEKCMPESAKNPTNPVVSEFDKIFRNNFDRSFLGRGLVQNVSKEAANDLWHDLKLFVKKIVDASLEGPFAMRLKEGEHGDPGALQFRRFDKKGNKRFSRSEEDEIKLKIERNRYMKLFLTAYFMSLVENYFFIYYQHALTLFNQIEGGKNWKQLSLSSNREAFARSVEVGIVSLMRNVRVDTLRLWLKDSSHESVLKGIQDKAIKEWKKVEEKSAKIGKEKLEKISAERAAAIGGKVTEYEDKGEIPQVPKEKKPAPTEEPSKKPVKQKTFAEKAEKAEKVYASVLDQFIDLDLANKLIQEAEDEERKKKPTE